MQHLDEGTIHTWLDGELPPSEREALEAHIASCEPCAAAVAEARGFVAASSRILMALDAVPGGVMPAPSHTSHAGATPARFTMSRAWMAVAAVLVLSTVSVIAIRSGSDGPLAKLEEARATHSVAPVTAPSAEEPAAGAAATAPAEKSLTDSVAARPRAPEESQSASAGASKAADKSRTTVTPERKNGRAPAPSVQSTSIADAARPAAAVAGATKPELPVRSPSPAADLDARMPRDSSPVSALAGKSPNTVAADSGRKRPPLTLSQVVVTGAGTTTPVEKLGSTVASNEEPRLLSRSTSTEARDTVVTTVYAVRNGTVTLIDRSSARDEVRRARNSSFSDQVMAKARDDTRINSITWSDSSGHTRTLRGALSRDELERIRAALFGPTP